MSEIVKQIVKKPFRQFLGVFSVYPEKMNSFDTAMLKAYTRGQQSFRYGQDEFGKAVWHEVKQIYNDIK